jgi:hypothetical protein
MLALLQQQLHATFPGIVVFNGMSQCDRQGRMMVLPCIPQQPAFRLKQVLERLAASNCAVNACCLIPRLCILPTYPLTRRLLQERR